MGGGAHGTHTTPNMNNMQETDEQMQGKIQSIELIKYNPQMFHKDVFDPATACGLLGGAPTLATSALGGLLSYGYFASQARTYNMYTLVKHGQARFFLGAVLGLAFGYQKFGDRQAVHNAYVAERLRRRYPESMDLHETDLWRFKGVQAPHAFYRWA